MKQSEVLAPTPIKYPVAYAGLKNNIPLLPTGTNNASITEGFPEMTMKALKDGGLPPRGEDFNGLFYLTTDQKAFFQDGGYITFDTAVSMLIGGYPKGAILDYYNESTNYYTKVTSLIDDNTNNFVENPALIDGINWQFVDFGTGANENLSNISSLALDRINQSKALITGNVANYEEELSQIIQMSHSTFDLSKFTVVGSPNITDDGIASGFSSSNYITISQDLSGYILKIQIPFKSNDITQEQDIISSNYVSAKITSSSYVSFTVSDGVNSKTITTSTTALLSNVDYLLDLIYNKSTYTSMVNVYASDGTVFDTASGTNTDNIVIPSDSITIKIGYGTNPLLGSADLKVVGVNINGIPVFSGNKTGIDTIKPVNFTAKTDSMKAFVYDTHTIYADSDSAPTELYNADGSAYTGTDWAINGTDVEYNGNTATYTSGSNITSVTNPPLPFEAGLKITVDGIASNFGQNNYIDKSMSIQPTKSLDMFFSFTLPESLTGSGCRIAGAKNSNQEVFALNISKATTNYYYQMPFGTTSITSINGWGYITDYIKSSELGKTTKFWLNWDGAKYTIKRSVNNAPWVTEKTITSSTPIAISTFRFGQAYTGMSTAYHQGAINLNELKIYVDGNLVYQPCLKIPYTEAGNGKGYNASTGSKIVNAIYRDRVNDMADQFGYANYYTLDEDSGNFTLPQVELYGYIEKRARDIAHPIAQPFFRFSDEINDDEVRLEGAEVDKGLYLAIEQDPYLSALCTAGSTNDKICLPNFRNRVIYGDVASGYIEPELPNITGTIRASNIWSGTGSASGCVTVADNGDHNACGDGGSRGHTYTWTLNASRSSSIYKDGGTVKTAGVKARWLCRWK